MMIKFGQNVFARQPPLSSQAVSATPPAVFPVNEFISLVCADKTKAGLASFCYCIFCGLTRFMDLGFGPETVADNWTASGICGQRFCYSTRFQSALTPGHWSGARAACFYLI